MLTDVYGSLLLPDGFPRSTSVLVIFGTLFS